MSGVSRSFYGRSVLIHSVYRHAAHLLTIRLSAVARLSIKMGLRVMSVDQMGSTMLCLLDQSGIMDCWFNTWPKTGGGLRWWGRGLTTTAAAADLVLNKHVGLIIRLQKGRWHRRSGLGTGFTHHSSRAKE